MNGALGTRETHPMTFSHPTHTAPGRGQQGYFPCERNTDLVLKGKKVVVEQECCKRHRIVLRIRVLIRFETDAASEPQVTFIEVLIKAGSENTATKGSQRGRTYHVHPE